jgi:hypothetical protein
MNLNELQQTGLESFSLTRRVRGVEFTEDLSFHPSPSHALFTSIQS